MTMTSEQLVTNVLIEIAQNAGADIASVDVNPKAYLTSFLWLDSIGWVTLFTKLSSTNPLIDLDQLLGCNTVADIIDLFE